MTDNLRTSPLSNVVPFTVKAISIIFLFLLSGWATSTADLIEQAQLTGDWSLVDKREEARDRRERNHRDREYGNVKCLAVRDSVCLCT